MSEIPPPPPYPPPSPPPGPRPGLPPATAQEPTLLSASGPEQPRRGRGPAIAVAVAGVLIIGLLAVAVPMAVDSDPVDKDRAVDLVGVRAYDGLEVDHVEGDVDYPQSPPVGGPHAPVWLECGAYDAPVREENAVHDLEHGAVWISYDPDLDADDVATLAGLLPQNGLLAPYPGLDAPVVVTVWGRQLDLTGADDPRLPLFIDTYGGGETAPEPFASCAGGVRSPDEGTGTGTAV